MANNSKPLGRVLKQQRLMVPLTLREMQVVTGIASSQLVRVERGDVSPSSLLLRKYREITQMAS